MRAGMSGCEALGFQARTSCRSSCFCLRWSWSVWLCAPPTRWTFGMTWAFWAPCWGSCRSGFVVPASGTVYWTMASWGPCWSCWGLFEDWVSLSTSHTSCTPTLDHLHRTACVLGPSSQLPFYLASSKDPVKLLVDSQVQMTTYFVHLLLPILVCPNLLHYPCWSEYCSQLSFRPHFYAEFSKNWSTYLNSYQTLENLSLWIIFYSCRYKYWYQTARND